MKKIFWIHPQLRDYRVGFFNKISELYEVKFLFLKKSEENYKLLADNEVCSADSLDSLSLKSLRWSDIYRIRHQIKNCDVVVSSFLRSYYTIIVILFAKIYGKRIIVWEEWYKKNNNKLKYKIRDSIGLFAMKKVDCIFTLGPKQEEFFINNGFDKSRIFRANEYPGVIYNTVPTVNISLPFDEKKKYILYLGRLIECKGVDILLLGFKELQKAMPDIFLVIVGDGPDRARLDKLIQSKDIKNVYFLGSITDVGQKSFLMKNATLGVVCSVETENKCDPGPLVTLELLSSGLPVVISDAVGNSYHVIDGKNGFHYPQRDISSLCRALKKCINGEVYDLEQRLKIFEKIEDYTYQSQKMDEAIKTALGD